MTDFDNMFHLAKEVLQYAYQPYSHFSVGACIRTSDGHYFTGCNVENASYGLTTCAEAAAIAMMVAAGKRHISEILVVADSDRICAPCGACRQRIREFSLPSTRIHFCNIEGDSKTLNIAELLPEAFGPDNLQIA